MFLINLPDQATKGSFQELPYLFSQWDFYPATQKIMNQAWDTHITSKIASSSVQRGQIFGHSSFLFQSNISKGSTTDQNAKTQIQDAHPNRPKHRTIHETFKSDAVCREPEPIQRIHRASIAHMERREKGYIYIYIQFPFLKLYYICLK